MFRIRLLQIVRFVVVECGRLKTNWRNIHLLIHVPVQAGVFQDEPVFLPFLGKIAFGILFFPEPTFTVALTQVFTGDPTLAD